MNIYINSIVYNNSLVDGPGIRSLIFFQGCDIHCQGCQNESTWDISKGHKVEVSELITEIKRNVRNKKITITGGEPLYQEDGLLELLKGLEGFDIALYTGHIKESIPNEILERVTYLKSGPFVERLKTSVMPYVGSSNQKFEKVGK